MADTNKSGTGKAPSEPTPEVASDPRRILEGHLRRSYGLVAYTHKTHLKCADAAMKKWERIRFVQIVLSAITTAGFVGTVFGTGVWAAIVGGLVSVVLLVVNAWVKGKDLSEVAHKHKQAAEALWNVREMYLEMIVDLTMNSKSLEVLLEQRDKLRAQTHAINQSAVSTNEEGYDEARKALKHQEELTFEDDEIDALLPMELRRSTREKGAVGLPSGTDAARLPSGTDTARLPSGTGTDQKE